MLHARKDYDRIQDPAHLIPEDEPVFLIRGQDVLGASTVQYWCQEAVRSGKVDREMIMCALEHAQRMWDWQRNHKRKIPDMPVGASRRLDSPDLPDIPEAVYKRPEGSA